MTTMNTEQTTLIIGFPISCSSAKQHDLIFGNNNVLRVRLDHVLTGKGKIMGATFFINVYNMQLHLYVEPKTCFYIMFTLSWQTVVWKNLLVKRKTFLLVYHCVITYSNTYIMIYVEYRRFIIHELWQMWFYEKKKKKYLVFAVRKYNITCS